MLSSFRRAAFAPLAAALALAVCAGSAGADQVVSTGQVAIGGGGLTFTPVARPLGTGGGISINPTTNVPLTVRPSTPDASAQTCLRWEGIIEDLLDVYDEEVEAGASDSATYTIIDELSEAVNNAIADGCSVSLV